MDKTFDLSVLGEVRGLLFDLDGTLYHQKPVQRRMAVELLMVPFLTFSPRTTRRVWRTIQCYRKLHEVVRARGHASENLYEFQMAETARRTGEDPEVVREIVEEWMLSRPLAHVASAMRDDLGDFLMYVARLGLRTGVLSDYPVEMKLKAMGLAEVFKPALCSSSPEINALKPHPRGFEHARAQWELPAHEVLYVGDRSDVDAAGARAAGMPCAILSTKETGPWFFRSMAELQGAMQAQR